MSSSVTITESELLEALNTALGSTAPADALTFEDIRRETGIGEKRLRAALRAIQVDGRLRVHAVMRRDLAGRGIKVPAYTITPKAKRNAKR